jgi:hypothetical protein
MGEHDDSDDSSIVFSSSSDEETDSVSTDKVIDFRVNCYSSSDDDESEHDEDFQVEPELSDSDSELGSYVVAVDEQLDSDWLKQPWRSPPTVSRPNVANDLMKTDGK